MNYEEARDELKSYMVARVPLIIFNTVEKERVLRMFKEINDSSPSSIFVHSMSNGMYDLNNKNIVSSEKTLMGALTFIASDLKEKSNVTYVITDVMEIENDNLVTRFMADLVENCEQKSSSIVLVTDLSVWANLRRLGLEIELEYPNEEEIYNLAKSFISKYAQDIKIEWDDKDFKKAATILLGLSAAEIKNVLSVLVANGEVLKTDLEVLTYAKSDLVSDMDGLEEVEVGDIQVAGLNTLRSWLDAKKKLFEVDNKELLSKKGLKPPRGILIVGVPGCGKSLTAKAVSKTFGMPLFLLDFAAIQGMYVGQSEERLRNALKTAEHVAPCILWIDEIEKGLSGANDSSGVTNRMIGQFLFWLQECKKEVFVVATANDVSKLPSELLRKGRFDELFFVDLPNDNERKEVLSLYLAKYLGIKVDDILMNNLVSITNGFASSDIESAIRDISYNVISDNLTLSQEYLINYLKSCTSIYKTNPEKVEEIRKWGSVRAKNAS